MRRKSGNERGLVFRDEGLGCQLGLAEGKSGVRVLLPIIVCLVLAEGFAGWWMSPVPAGLGRAVLAPKVGGVSAGGGVGEVRMTRQPAIVSVAMPTLKCSDGMAARLDLADGTPIHYAYFAWDYDTAGNVLQAFRHLPEECLGAIGMKLVAVHPPRAHEFDGVTLHFDHTEFRDLGGAPVHAFKAVWVSGGERLLGEGLRSGSQAWRTLRMRAAAERFRPAYTRVLQGAVHRVVNADAAWDLFEGNVLARFGFSEIVAGS